MTRHVQTLVVFSFNCHFIKKYNANEALLKQINMFELMSKKAHGRTFKDESVLISLSVII